MRWTPGIPWVPLPPVVLTERAAAQVLIEKSSKYVRRLTHGEYMVRMEDGVWKIMDEAEAIREIGTNHIPEAHFYWPEKTRSGMNLFHHGVAVSSNIGRFLLRKIPKEPFFSQELQDNVHMRLFYENGFYDFSERRFETRGGDFLIASRICTRFPADPEPGAVDEFMERILKPIFPIEDERNGFLTFLARGFAGEVTEKRWGAFIGERNVGKTLISDALFAAFPNAAYDLDGRNLMDTLEAESARVYSFAMGTLEHSAVAVCNELPSKGNLSGDKMKKLASGGEFVTARQMYSEARRFLPRARLLLCANKLPKVTPDDANKTLVWFQGRTEFVKAPLTPEHLAANSAFEEDPLGTALRYNIKRPEYKKYVKTPRAVAAFTHILLSAYRDTEDYLPQSVLEPGNASGATVSPDVVVSELVIATGVSKDFISEDRIKKAVRARTRQPAERAAIEVILVQLSKDAGYCDKESKAAWTQRGVPANRIGGWRFVRERTAQELTAVR